MGNPRYAFVFPGQGSQYVGMGAELRAASPLLDRTLRRAGQLTGQDVAGAMLRGPEERLADTVNTQLSVFAVSVALHEAVTERGLRPVAVAGHSLGEYAALVAGGWLELDDALIAVARRAKAMRACCARTEGAMAAVLGLRPEALVRLAADGPADAVVANANSPKQSVISGTADAVAKLGELALERGASAVIPLTVDGAFHSPLMGEAEERLLPLVAELPLKKGRIPIVSSVSGEVVTDPRTYRALLARQITSPVRWADVMVRLRGLSVGAFAEVGPGKVLRGLFRHLDRRIPVVGVGSFADCLEITGTAAGTASAVAERAA
ncbi:ACP S-malonyltransferase [Streptomyces sp. LHD-70]|uniref:ACP S-malonyltransferase n=1 Tax=Streptomyces sp. LHD-70 TaxID=3072140 RepID=UPI0028107058|nr:ACP S-malonyltransferase [Streptomyces sp. LHD-70]MDQ8705980.1 ACP S-malonyltransferase [Streptomyces sp. LHD-70]